MSVKPENGLNTGLGTSIFNRYKATRKAKAPTIAQDETPGGGSDLKGKRPSKLGLKRWLVGSRSSSSTLQLASVRQDHERGVVLDASTSQPAPQQRTPERTLFYHQKVSILDHPLSLVPLRKSEDENEQWEEPLGDPVFPIPSDLDFPPPPPHALCQNDCSDIQDLESDTRRFKGELVEGRVQERSNSTRGKHERASVSTLPKRTRSMLNERTFTMTPRYSPGPQFPPSRSRPSSRVRSSSSSFNDKRPLSAPLVRSSSLVIPHIGRSISAYTAPASAPPVSSQIPQRQQEWSRLFNPLPLPPGWVFQPESTIPVRRSSTSLSRTHSSSHENLRESRSRNRSESTHRRRFSPHHPRRPPSPRPRPTSLSPFRNQRSPMQTHSPHRSWTSSSPIRSLWAKDPRMASFTSLGSILGGNSSECDSSSDSSSCSSDGINVIVSVHEDFIG